MGTVSGQKSAATMRLLPFLLLALHPNILVHAAPPDEAQISRAGQLIAYPRQTLARGTELNNLPRYNVEGSRFKKDFSGNPEEATFERKTKSVDKNQDGILFQRLTRKIDPDDQIFERLTKRGNADDDKEVFLRLTKKNDHDEMSHYILYSYLPFEKMTHGLRPLSVGLI